MIIPRDPSVVIPGMFLQNVTRGDTNDTSDDCRFFKYHQVQLKEMSSIHLEVHPLNINLSYLFVYHFDPSLQHTDGWTIFSTESNSKDLLLLLPSFWSVVDHTDDHTYRYFLDNEQTANHQSLIFGLRELNSTEVNTFSSSRDLPTFTEPVFFTSNYELRLYTSSCLYFDEDQQQWKFDGMKVGPKTNHFQTQCFSTHI